MYVVLKNGKKVYVAEGEKIGLGRIIKLAENGSDKKFNCDDNPNVFQWKEIDPSATKQLHNMT